MWLQSVNKNLVLPHELMFCSVILSQFSLYTCVEVFLYDVWDANL